MQPPTDLDHGGEMGLQGTRPAEVLKLWLGLRQLGEEGIEAVLASALHRRALFAAALDPQLMQVLPGDLHVLAMHPTQMSAAETERWSESTRQSLLASGFMLSRPRYRQRFCLKAVFGNPHTTLCHQRQGCHSDLWTLAPNHTSTPFSGARGCVPCLSR